MKVIRVPIVATTLLLLCLAADKPVFKRWLSPDHFDARAIMGDPPAAGSPEHAAELATMLDLQARRTADEIARCKSEEEVNVFAFTSVLGDGFNAKDLPLTAALMNETYEQTKSVSTAAKKLWNRKRPSEEDPRIKPCVKWEMSSSYPSGHATRGMMWATLLAEIFPQQKEKLLEKGRQIGTDRNIAGMHWPSDVVSSQKFGVAIAEQLLKDDDFKAELVKVKEECLAVKR